jgi:hypothetical protein
MLWKASVIEAVKGSAGMDTLPAELRSRVDLLRSGGSAPSVRAPALMV